MSAQDELRQMLLSSLRQRITRLNADAYSRPSDALREAFAPAPQNSIAIQALAGIISIALVLGFWKCSDRVREGVREAFRPADPGAHAAGERAGREFAKAGIVITSRDQLSFLAVSESRENRVEVADRTEWQKGFMAGYRKHLVKPR